MPRTRQVIYMARQAEAYEVVAWLRWTNGNSGDAENDLQEVRPRYRGVASG